MATATGTAAQELLHSPRGLFLISQGIGILRKLATADGQGDKLPPDAEIIARLFPDGSAEMVLDEGSSTLIAAALLCGSRVLALEVDPPRHADVADMRLLLTLFKSKLPAALLAWPEPPSGDQQ
jgi:hypothetical protein